MTVEALFDYAEAAKADADEFDIEFDRELGYPRMISVDHDPQRRRRRVPGRRHGARHPRARPVRAPGCRRPRRGTRRAAGRLGRRRRRTRRRAPRGRAPTAPGSVTPEPLDRPLVLLGQRDVGHREVVGVERHPDAGLHQAPERVVLEGRDDPRLDVRGGAQVEPGPAPDQLRDAASGSSIASGPWAIRSGSMASDRRTCAAPPHSPAWSGDVQADRRARGRSPRGGAPGRGSAPRARRGRRRPGRPGRRLASRSRDEREVAPRAGASA